ncbi:MAG: HD-GYP domain-containing protein [Candidatus Nitrospinota bacterium M3_3B_026]
MSEDNTGRILIVDDEESIRTFINRRLSRLGYECRVAEDGAAALAIAAGEKFDVALTDINMPRMDGLELLRRLRGMDETISVIMVTAVVDMNAAVTSLKEGALDYITKPIESEKLVVSVANAVEKARLLRENIDYRDHLERMVEERSAEVREKSLRLKQFFVETTMALVSAIEAKDKYTEGHSRRVAEYSRKTALKLGLSGNEAEMVFVAGSLHDIGKIGIPDRVLSKPGVFNDEERRIMNRHSTLSANILAYIEDYKDIKEMVLSHHERYDGDGYPEGLAGEAIPLGARILAVADTFDAMTSERPYRPRMSAERAVEEIRRGMGQQFDQRVAAAFIALVEEGEIDGDKG